MKFRILFFLFTLFVSLSFTGVASADTDKPPAPFPPQESGEKVDDEEFLRLLCLKNFSIVTEVTEGCPSVDLDLFVSYD